MYLFTDITSGKLQKIYLVNHIYSNMIDKILKIHNICTTATKINVIPKGVRLSEKL